MKLAIDTSLSSGSIALGTEERIIYSAFFDIKITHSETLMPAIDIALKFCDITQKDLSAIYICSGPGSFTGIRIGIATAKGIAMGLGLPLFAYSSLELAALEYSGLGKNILVCIDAKMKEIYCGFYDPCLREIISPQVLKPDDICQLSIDKYILCGSAAPLLTPLLKAAGRIFYPVHPATLIPNAGGLFALGDLLPHKHVQQDMAALEPLYLRESTAQVQKNKSLKK
ncbi:MAG: tRNA (adenosine(37)-N6)-threonylcarbamoyltransferase complex dimerization subunit type 1 TsaB [Candidatus Cloacimonas sp.]|nr:tRNA (adenosine(37)-N6)-threonylcarbamoyltransferase complex dimerization subunit type 1 TsaB [Candidatus Cloacimonas sp.]